MKKKLILTLLCLSAAGFAIPLTSAHADVTLTRAISEKSKHAIEDIKLYSIEKKEAAREKAKEVVEDIDNRINALEDTIADKKNGMTDAIREAKTRSVIKLKEKRNDVKDWYEKFSGSTKNAWEEIKEGFVRSYESFQDTYNES